MRKGPEFIQYMKPIVDILKSRGGSGKAGEIVDQVIEQMAISEEDLAVTNKNGGSRIKNQVHWARQYLVSYGALDNSVRGIWTLTPEGKTLKISDHADALNVFDTVQKERRESADENVDEVDASQDENNYWFVGASYGRNRNQMDRFLREGIWECGYDEKYRTEIEMMKVGDPIAIKAAYTRKRNVPFDNKGNVVSVMAIKATGVITEAAKDGRSVKVDWKPQTEVREWYFFTMRTTVWRVTPGRWYANELIAFTFDNKPQNYLKFINEFEHLKHLRDADGVDFSWVDFYMEFADRLLKFKHDRASLLKAIFEIAERNDNLNYFLNDQFADGTKGPLRDICPFTFIGSFNRGLTEENRVALAREYATLLDISAPVPVSFPGIPTLNNQSSWFFSYEKKRQPNDIDKQWDAFEAALQYADAPSDENQERLCQAYDRTLSVRGIRRNIALGMYWARPLAYVPLDQNSSRYILEKLHMDLPVLKGYSAVPASDYLEVIDRLSAMFDEEDYPVKSFPELSHAAYHATYEEELDQVTEVEELAADTETVTVEELADVLKQMYEKADSKTTAIHLFGIKYAEQIQASDGSPKEICISAGLPQSYETEISKGMRLAKHVQPIGAKTIAPSEVEQEIAGTPYTVDDIVKEGAFVPQQQLDEFLARLKTKKNLILQGPPGTGKTWLAKRLAYSLVGEKRPRQVTSVQFHPNLSYEDFICGFRPNSDGKLILTEGPFMQMVTRAIKYPHQTFVLVIEEINRGNPAQIFGEALTLLEADKRTADDAMKLSYAGENDRTYIPDNFYVIGTMNIADRSLALVDLALRRRFAFVDLTPRFDETWISWIVKRGFEDTLAREIQRRITKLNRQIEEDNTLGAQFKVGHSYLTPGAKQELNNPEEWYAQVVKTEIAPLLEEYWFDDHELAREAVKALLEGI